MAGRGVEGERDAWTRGSQGRPGTPALANVRQTHANTGGPLHSPDVLVSIHRAIAGAFRREKVRNVHLIYSWSPTLTLRLFAQDSSEQPWLEAMGGVSTWRMPRA